MKDTDIQELLKKAKRSLAASKQLLKSGYPDFAASRGYYAMFYATEAILLTKNLSYSKHSAVISGFGKEFVKRGFFASSFHRDLLDAFDLRQMGDYAGGDAVDRKTVLKLLKQAEKFIAVIEKYLNKL